jgi:PTS system sucrose-specific IIC component
MANKFEVMSQSILEQLGGIDNVVGVSHCATRLRVTLKDKALADQAKIRDIDGVLGCVEQGGQIQIILGHGNAPKVSSAFGKLTGKSVDVVDEVLDRKAELKKKNNTPFKNFLRKLANVFIPLIPAFIGCGIIYGASKILYNVELIDKNMYNMLSVIGKGIFTYMNIMVGMNVFKAFGGSPALGCAISGILMADGLAKITIGGNELVPGEGGIIAVLIACALGAMLEKWLRKVMPGVIDLILTPTIVLLVIGFGSLFIIHPLGAFLSEWLGIGVTYLIDKGGILIGALLSGTFLPLVMTGLHRALTPIEVSLIDTTGVDLLRPILAMAGAGQVGAGIAIYLKTKNKKLKKVLQGALPIGLMGIGEPLMFGVTLPLGKPFITACIGSIVGGAYVSVMKVASIGIGLSGLPLTLLIPQEMMIHYLIGTVLAYAGGFVLTYFTKWEDMGEDDSQTEENQVLNEVLHLK